MPLPPGHKGLVVCDAGRARQWRIGLTRAGFAPVIVETTGADADKGDYQVGVPDAQAREAQKLVSAVVAGRAELPVDPAGRAKRVLVGLLVTALIASLVLAFAR